MDVDKSNKIIIMQEYFKKHLSIARLLKTSLYCKIFQAFSPNRQTDKYLTEKQLTLNADKTEM